MNKQLNPAATANENGRIKRQSLVVTGSEAVRAARMSGVEVMAERMGGEVMSSATALIIRLEAEAAPQGMNQIIERLRDHGINSFSRCFPYREKSRCVGHAPGSQPETCANCCAAVVFYKP